MTLKKIRDFFAVPNFSAKFAVLKSTKLLPQLRSGIRQLLIPSGQFFYCLNATYTGCRSIIQSPPKAKALLVLANTGNGSPFSALTLKPTKQMQTAIQKPGAISPAIRAMRAVGALLNRQSLPAVVILGTATFFAFTLGAPRFGAVAGMLFMLAVRPFAARPIEEKGGAA